MSVAFPSRPQEIFNQRRLLQGFWFFVALCVAWGVLLGKPSTWAAPLGAGLIAVTALLPGYLWCSGRAIGFPLFPLFALTYLGAYGSPLLNGHERVAEYGAIEQLIASITVAGFLGLGTFVWWLFVHKAPPLPTVVRAFNPRQGEPFFWFGLLFDTLFMMSLQGQWLKVPTAVFSTLRATSNILGSTSAFGLTYLWGQKMLSSQKRFILIFILAISIMVRMSNLLLNNGMPILFCALVGFLLGRKQVNWRFWVTLGCIMLLLGLLHVGKGELRAKYWGEGVNLQPWDYPARYSEWLDNSFQKLGEGSDGQDTSTELTATGSLMQRGSLMHLLLFVQSKSPSELPFLNGVTYLSLPSLLLPRVLNPDKVWSHEGNYILNVYYGLQSVTQVFQTTVGWGLLNEAYANFGFIGCGLLALVVGGGYGFIARWSYGCPVFSARFMYMIMLTVGVLSTEWSASVYVSSLGQTTSLVVVLAYILMKPQPLRHSSIAPQGQVV
ncbi:MAG: hypothetical protein IGQ88_04850 [Gloeomargaritaceae cyanobacterium C42_A2020_066]|nr:hypothetical protein [Gloeomargaritaceae cyanobacterium C42_A2020_066]